ncbi:MAG: EAL domain-containing protein [Microlunatus sp.]
MDRGATTPVRAAQPHRAEDGAAVEIAAALAAGEFRPWYQPIVELATDRVVGVEALVRRHHPSGAVETPASFLPVAERSDLVLDIDRTILRQALADLAGWLRLRPDFRVSVNLSGRQLDRPELPAELTAAVAAAGLAAGTIDLEITETTRPENPAVNRDVITRLRDLGYAVRYDDFGTGWSSLPELIRMPVDGIKLDRGFADHLGTRIGDAVIGALVAAGDQVGFTVTIEGIEQREQAERARTLGCHYGQGFWWSRPRPGVDIPELISG